MRKLIPLLALLVVACQDLAVTNPNEPDRERATQEPTSVESFVATSFRTWWGVGGHDDYPSWAFSTMAHEITSGFADFGQFETSAEPRSSWNNSPVNARHDVAEAPWYGFYGAISPVNDALIAIDSGLVIGDENRTARTRAVGKFIQGISHGYLALYYDQAFIADEHLAVDTITTPVFHPHAEVAAAAIEELDSAIAISGRSNFELPVDSWLFVDMTQDDLARLANSFAARILAYAPRTRAERAAVDWNEVIRRVDAGITTDFAPVAQPDILWDDWKRLIARVRSGPPSDFGRPSYWVLGPADSTDGYVNWLATPLQERGAFQLQTTDKRIQMTGFPDSAGSYVGYSKANIGSASRGTWRYSWYYYHRFGTSDSWQSGPEPALTVTEMDLLKAEALIRLGRAAEAVPLINKTRVANGGLPPVTVDGPPDEQGCVPRKANGACGSLWDALRYEKRIEGLGVSGVVAFFDARGWQTLPANSFVQLPVPGRELGTLRLPLYTFGGPGGESSAPEPDDEACPVALARCL
ncbi:MAG TPA: RagB/SusD family nutrient uptake outer membrane protein [Gemmatimonadaceae bacterium]